MNNTELAVTVMDTAQNILSENQAAQAAESGSPIAGYIFLGLLIIVGGAFIYFVIKFRKRFAILNEFLTFLWKEKMWWMIPLILILLGMGLLIFFSSSSGALAPFIYPLF